MERTGTWQGPAAKISLEVIAGPHQGMRFQFDQPTRFLVGRAPDVNLQLLEDAHFSRHHFELELDPPRCYLRDLGSSNGTFVNGRKVTECALGDGDVISGGRTRIRIALHTTAQAGTAPAEDSTQFVQGHSSWVPHTWTVAQALTVSPGVPKLLVPGYEIERLLGQGGMGAVYLARRETTGECCALKVILPESAADERVMKLFLREVSVLRQLDHPRIVRFQEIGMHLGQFFFAMEYVETVDLRHELTRLGQAERIATACGLVCQVLEGLGYAHELGFVHRDIKPANLLVSREGGQLGARLADFGLAKNFENAGLSGMTHEGALLGTVPFMAPEQATRARFARPGVDIYSMGATLYNLLTGQLPHDFSKRKDPLAVIQTDEPISPQRHCPWLPEGLVGLLLKALARDPADRFATAADMRQALLPYSAGIGG
jgi:serine/threonine-protein kinase